MQRDHLLNLDSATFHYGQKMALSNVSATWAPGIVGLLGPNGAGKTTLLKILAGIHAPSSGRMQHAGHQIVSRPERSRWRNRVGFLPQNPHWLPELSVISFVTYFARLRLGRGGEVNEAVEQALTAVNIHDLRHDQLGKLSGGQRQRAFIAQALVHKPDVLILDEPTAGLDPRQRVDLRSTLSDLSENRWIFLSTHLVEDLDHLADEIAILDEGSLVWSGTVAELRSAGRGTTHGDSSSASDLELGYLAASIMHRTRDGAA